MAHTGTIMVVLITIAAGLFMGSPYGDFAIAAFQFIFPMLGWSFVGLYWHSYVTVTRPPNYIKYQALAGLIAVLPPLIALAIIASRSLVTEGLHIPDILMVLVVLVGVPLMIFTTYRTYRRVVATQTQPTEGYVSGHPPRS